VLEQVERQLLAFAKDKMNQDQAHDLNHVLRVVRTAKELCNLESARLEIVLPAAYLHDCFSFPKNHPERAKSSNIAAEKAIEFLSSISYPEEYFESIRHAIVAHSYSADVKPMTIEAEIVQDADRLDALGAIGIARCLQVGASMGIALYRDEDPFCANRIPNDSLYSIDHFYKKLTTIKNTMNTVSAKTEAEKRTDFMHSYLRQLAAEV